MNAVISLCHFCEIHGPKILFCTQPIRPQESLKNVETEDVDGCSLSSRRVKSPSTSSASSVMEGHSPALLSSAVISPKTDRCEGCYSVQTGFVSHDEDAQVSYVSTQQPYHPQVFSRIRQACIRSLSCEVCPGREGPIFFGDEQNGQVLSYTFYIKDNQARGFQRLYSILVVMMDKIYLLNSWPFLVPHLKIIVENLQVKAQKVCDAEHAKCPQRAYRLTQSINPSNFILQRGGNKPARSLIELTNDKHVFQLLHVSFLWVLKACSNRITETLLEGPPTEDSIIDMEKQEETEEGFIKLFSKKVGMSDDADRSQPASSDEDGSDNEVMEPLIPTIKNLRQLRKVLGSAKFRVIAHHAIIGNQIIVSGAQKPLVKSMLNALKNLLPKGCCRVIHYSNAYEESWRCNFLGLTPDVVLPKHMLLSEMFVYLEIKLSDDATEMSPEDPNSLDSEKSDCVSDFSCYEFQLSSPIVLPDKVPSVLSKMELALRNENLTDEVVDQCFACIKEEWMNKVKVLFKFTKAGGNRSEEDTKRLLQIVGAQEEDKQLMKFWMTGLSVQYKTHILASSKTQV